MEAGWLFCPYCGVDNRPETFRPMLLACPHRFFGDEGFCVRCGECRDGRPTAAQRAVQFGIAKKFLFLGVLSYVATIGIMQIHQNHWFGNQFIIPWYDEPYSVDGKTAFKGNDYMEWAQMGGEALSGLGVLALLAALIANRKRSKRK